MDDEGRSIRECAVRSTLHLLKPAIRRPDIQAEEFKLKPVMFQMLQMAGLFGDMANENPHLHLRQFMEVCDSFKMQGVTEEVLRLILFLFSLRDRDHAWLNTLPSNSIFTWNDLVKKFLMKYCRPTKSAKLSNDITAFHQFDAESLYYAWESFKELLRVSLHHDNPGWVHMETFYNELSGQMRSIFDDSSNFAFLSKSFGETYDILETMSNNNHQWHSERVSNTQKIAGVHQLDPMTTLIAQVSSLSHVLKSMNLGIGAKNEPTIRATCTRCGGEYLYDNCPSNLESTCHIFNRSNNPYYDLYDLGCRQQPNINWSSQGQHAGHISMQNKHQNPPGFTQPVEHVSQMEKVLNECMEKTDSIIQSNAVLLRKMENQVGQIMNALSNRPHSTLSSGAENSRRKDKEYCKT